MKFAIFSAVLGTILTIAPAFGQEAGGEPPPPAVVFETLTAQDVTLTATLPGRVRASAQAELRPQVNGIIQERLFEEGSVVKEGDPLYRIDDRVYQATVAQAEAALAQAKAQADSASREADRVATLRDRRVASEQTQESAIATRDAALAAVQSAQAQLEAAQIDLDRTTIAAPIDGVIGLAMASKGVLVSASQAEPLAVIRSIDPVHVDVTQSAAELMRRQKSAAGHAPEEKDQTVKLTLADDTVFEQSGSLTAGEPHVDETTGVVTLRMSFPNPDGILLPGMYVLVELPQAVLKDAVLAPQEGVSRDRRGNPIAMVVNDQNVVEQREIEIVQDRGNDWIVKSGLEAGDRIIVEGLQRIGVGMTVAPEERPADADAATPPADGAKDEPSAEQDDPSAAKQEEPAAETQAPAEDTSDTPSENVN